MPLVIRQYTYVAGALIIAAQNNANEDTLYALVNGNLDADNISGLAESEITFNPATGHNHDGANSRKIDVTGAGFIIRVVTNATDHALIGRSSVATKAGLFGEGTGASSLGVFGNSTISSGIGIDATNTGGGIALRAQNAASGSDHAVSFINNSTTAAKAALAITNSGTQATSAGLIISTNTTGYGIFITNTAAGTPIRIERSTTAFSNLIDMRITGTANNSTVGLAIDHDGDTTAGGKGIEIITAGAEGITISNTANDSAGSALGLTVTGGAGAGANSTPLVLFLVNKTGTSGAGGALHVENSAVDNPVCTIQGNIADTGGTASTDDWVLRVRNTGAAGTNENSLYVEGRSMLDGDVDVSGDLDVTGTLTKGAGAFLIDHPLDPKNKNLHHSFIESPDMKNLYDGIVELDNFGFAEIQLPEYFLALNKDFRYQLTPIGHFSESLFPVITKEIDHNGRFRINGASFSKVSWQVTGTRKDRYAEANRIKVEEDKAPGAGYIHPEVWADA